MHKLRAIKSASEIEALQHACDITEKGFRRLLSFIKPGVMEYEIEAELLHEFVRNRSRGFAYEPIIASGFNACVLHYIENNKECKDGDVILLDVTSHVPSLLMADLLIDRKRSIVLYCVSKGKQ
jgi:Xaa-Pro aminopeptidase